MSWGIIMDENNGKELSLCRVVIYLQDEKTSCEGWAVGNNVLEVANRLRNQSVVLLASNYRSLKEAGWDMSKSLIINAYNSTKIVRYNVEEYAKVQQADNDDVDD